jgi:hypothetical protein
MTYKQLYDYSEYEQDLNTAYAIAAEQQAEIASINEQIAALSQEINVSQDMIMFNADAFHKTDMALSKLDSVLYGIDKEIFNQQAMDIMMENSAVNASAKDMAAVLENRKENIYIALANAYDQNELGDLIPVLEQEKKILENYPSPETNDRLEVYDIIIKAYDKRDIDGVELHDVADVDKHSRVYLMAVEHLGKNGYEVDATQFGMQVHESIINDIKDSKNLDSKQVFDSVKAAVELSDIDDDLKATANSIIDKMVEKESEHETSSGIDLE